MLRHDTSALQIRGVILELGEHFGGTLGGLAEGSGYDPETLAAAAGTRTVDLGASWQIARGLTVTSSHKSVSNDKFGDPKRGLTTVDATHAMVLGLGANSTLKTSLEEHREHWDPVLRKSGKCTSTRRVELESTFGSSGSNLLRLAMTSVERSADRVTRVDRKNELHLVLAPAQRLRLNADYLDEGKDGESTGTSRSVGAVLELAPGAELSAGIKSLDRAQGASAREALLKMAADLGSGWISGNTTLEQTVVSGEGAPKLTKRTCAFTGAVGSGEQRANVSASFEEASEAGVEGKLTRSSALRIERPLGPRIRLAAERCEKVTGSKGRLETALHSKCVLDFELGGSTAVQTSMTSGRDPGGPSRARRTISVQHRWGSMQLKSDGEVTYRGDDRCSALGFAVEAPAGELPDWAKGIAAAHQFEDAKEYLIADDPAWVGEGMAFAGYRLAVKQRRGGPDGGTNSYSIAHRRIIGGRYHLHLVHEQFPEATRGPNRGRPQALRRSFVGLGMPLSSGLTARCSYSSDASLGEHGDQLSRIGLGIWGRLSEQEQLEAAVHHDSGRWHGSNGRRTSLSVLYDLQVSEEHHLTVKAGYGWGRRAPEADAPDCRLTLGYTKPI